MPTASKRALIRVSEFFSDEEAVSKMMSMMEDKKLQEEFPLLAQVS